MGAPYGFRVNVDVDFTTGGKPYRLRASDENRNTFTTDDPCAFLQAFVAAQTALPPDARGFDDEDVATLKAAAADCRRRRPDLAAPASVPQASEPPPTNVDPSPPASDVRTEGGEESPSSLQAPDPKIAGTVFKQPPQPGEDDPRRPAEQIRDARLPRTEQEIADQLSAKGADEEQIQEELDAARKNLPPALEPHPEFSGNQQERPAKVVDPVIISSGQFQSSCVDVEIASVGFPLSFERIYRSGATYYGPFGFGWDHNYNVYLRPLSQGRMAVWTGRLSEDIYVPAADGSFDPPLGVFRKLERAPSAGILPDRWILGERGGRKLVFDVPPSWPLQQIIPLTSVEDAAGNAQALTYDVQGRLDRVTDRAGRYLALDYGDCGLLERLRDHTGRNWRYQHDPEIEHLVACTTPPTREFPAGRTTRYLYDRFNRHTALQHDLVAIVDPDGRVVVENQYGEDPMTADFGRVVRQEFGGFESELSATVLQFVPPTAETLNTPAVRVEVIDPGYYYVYTFNWRGDLLDKRNRLVADGSYRLVASTYRYDEQGNLSEQYAADGRGFLYEYDHLNPDPRARGNLLRMVRRASPLAPAIAQDVFRATYEPQLWEVKSFSDAEGAVTQFVYDYELTPLSPARGALRRLIRPQRTLPDGTVVQDEEELDYNPLGQLVEHRINGCVHTFEYESTGPQTGYMRSRQHTKNGVTIRETFERDAVGNLVARIDGVGNRQDYTVDAMGRVAAIRLADGSLWGFEYDGSNRLSAVVQPRGRYDDATLAGQPIRHTQRYDVLGHLLEEVLGANTDAPRRTTWTFNAEGKATFVRDPLGRTLQQLIDERGLVIREELREAQGTLARRRRFAYGKVGQLLSTETEGAGRVVLAYDGFGRLRSVEGPDGTIARYRVDRRDAVVDIEIEGRTGGPGTATGILARRRFEYDEAGFLRRQFEEVFDSPGAASTDIETRFFRDGEGQATRTITPRGLFIEHVRGPYGLLREERDSLGSFVRIGYDAAGRQTGIERDLTGGGASSALSTISYDSVGRVRLERDALGNEALYEYDERGVLWRMTNPAGRQIEHEVDAFGDIVSQRLASWASRWRRDAAGRVDAFTDPTGTETRFEYDSLDRLGAVVRPDLARQTYAYEASGALASFEDFDATRIEYTNDPNGLPIRLTATPGPGVAATPDIELEWDGMRRIVRARHGAADHRFRYDSLTRLLEERGPQSVNAAWDAQGAVCRVSYPDGRRDRHEHDVLGRCARIVREASGTAALGTLAPGAELARFTWAADRIETLVVAGSVQTVFDYDPADRPTGTSTSGAASVFRQRWFLDPLGVRRAETVEAPVASVNEYRYDDLTRLELARRGMPAAALPPAGAAPTQAQSNAAIASLAAAPASSSSEWQYTRADTPARQIERDDVGAITVDRVLTTNALHELTSWDGWPVTHSGAGPVTSFVNLGFTYDAYRRLVGVRAAGAPVMSIRYDGIGRVHERDDAAGTEQYAYFRDELLQVSGANAAQRVPSPLLDRTLLVSNAQGDFILVRDGMGSLVAACDVAGGVVERFGYAEFGTPTVLAPDGITIRGSSAIGLVPEFQGRPWLPASQLYDFRNRVYEPRLQSFLQPDLFMLSGSWSHYGFVRYNPIGYADPYGLFWHGVIIGGVIGGVGAALSGGSWQDVLVGIGTGAVAGGFAACGLPVLGAAIAGGLQGAWSGGRIGYKLTGTVGGTVMGGLAGAAFGAPLGALSGGVATRAGNAVSSRVYGTLFNQAMRRGLTGRAIVRVARYGSMVAGGYAGGASSGVFGNVTSTVAMDLALDRPLTRDQLQSAAVHGLAIDGPLNAVGAVGDRFLYVRRFPGQLGNVIGAEGEGLVGRELTLDPSNGAVEIEVNGNARRPDFDPAETMPAVGGVVEVKNKQRLSQDDVAQIADFAQHAAANGGVLILRHRPGMDLTPLAGIGNIVPVPISQLPLVVPILDPVPRDEKQKDK